jgi:lipoprotein-anchoring transpeptidase ErfK/SrfK
MEFKIMRALRYVGVLCLLASSQLEARELVNLQAQGYQRGQIIVKSNERRLYLILNEQQAIRYPVAVGKPGKQWFGAKYIDGKHVQPAWSPPADVKRDNPNLPDVIAGGSSHNPMGERALTLTGGAYAIHGTNRPESIGKFASYGCIRMLNEDIKDLYERVSVGTSVMVVR